LKKGEGMSDEQQDLNLEDVGAAEEAGPKKPRIFSGLILTILKWAGIGIGIIILVVTVTVVTFSILSKGGSSQNLAASSPEYAAKSEPLAYYDNIDAIRGQTADETPAIFLVRLSLGYDTKAKDVSVEIGQRAREIQDMVLGYLAGHTATELGSTHYEEIKADLLNLINKVMRTGKIKSITFREFSVLK
jgi:flagellar basal body-associated protein FliL